MHDLLYENQEALEDEDLAQYASTLGLDARRLMSDVQADTHATRIREDFRSGARHGVNGTPSFFINGVRYEGTPAVEELLAALTGESV
jgi:protein-disulfide isomerase